MKKIKDVLGDNCRALRQRTGISQVDLAERVGVSRSTIVKIENGTVWPDLQTLEALAGALGSTPELMLTSYSSKTAETVKKEIEFVNRYLTTLLKLLPEDVFQALGDRKMLMELVKVAKDLDDVNLETLKQFADEALAHQSSTQLDTDDSDQNAG